MGDIAPACFDCFEDVNLAADEAGRAAHNATITRHRELLLAHFYKDIPGGCPDDVSQVELDGTDLTFERTWD